MTAATAALWLTLLGPANLTEGDTLPPGMHAVATLLQACQALDPTPILTEHPGLSSRAVEVPRALVITPSSSLTLDVLLRTAGVFRVMHRNREQEPFWFITTDPKKRPPEELGFRVKTWRVEHVDAVQVATILNASVQSREADLPKHLIPTAFVGHRATQSIVIRYREEQDLVPYVEILKDLDVPRESERVHSLRNWRARHRTAANLAADLEKQWELLDRGPLHIVIHKASNNLLIRVPSHSWPRVEELLRYLDSVAARERKDTSRPKPQPGQEPDGKL